MVLFQPLALGGGVGAPKFTTGGVMSTRIGPKFKVEVSPALFLQVPVTVIPAGGVVLLMMVLPVG